MRLVAATLVPTLLGVASCASTPAPATVNLVTPEHRCLPASAGNLIVYSATYAQTLEQSEYPAHTDYSVATEDDKIIRRVANNTGSFGASPALVELPCGNYRVRAQYEAGRFVVVALTVQSGKTTILDLAGEPGVRTQLSP